MFFSTSEQSAQGSSATQHDIQDQPTSQREHKQSLGSATTSKSPLHSACFDSCQCKMYTGPKKMQQRNAKPGINNHRTNSTAHHPSNYIPKPREQELTTTFRKHRVACLNINHLWSRRRDAELTGLSRFGVLLPLLFELRSLIQHVHGVALHVQLREGDGLHVECGGPIRVHALRLHCITEGGIRLVGHEVAQAPPREHCW